MVPTATNGRLACKWSSGSIPTSRRSWARNYRERSEAAIGRTSLNSKGPRAFSDGPHGLGGIPGSPATDVTGECVLSLLVHPLTVLRRRDQGRCDRSGRLREWPIRETSRPGETRISPEILQESGVLRRHLGRPRTPRGGMAREKSPGQRVEVHAGCGAAWLARLTGGQEVAGSNPASPTEHLSPPMRLLVHRSPQASW